LRGDGQRGQRAGAHQVDGHDEPSPVEPVDVGATDQGEQQPWHLLGEDGTSDQCRVATDGGDQQWAGRHGDTVTDVGHRRSGPQFGEVRAKTRGYKGTQRSSSSQDKKRSS
jgi:hypothetical protein